MTTFSASLTNLTAFIPQSRDFSSYVSDQYWHFHHSESRNTLMYAQKTSRTLRTCDISRGSLTLHASVAGYIVELILPQTNLRGPGSSVGIATELRAGWSGIESQWGRDFPSVQTGPGAHPASCTMGTESFPRVKCGRGVLLDHSPPSSVAVMEE